MPKAEKAKKVTHTVSVVEPVTRRDGSSMNLWHRVGSAQPHKDGKGFNVYIDGRTYVVRES